MKLGSSDVVVSICGDCGGERSSISGSCVVIAGDPGGEGVSDRGGIASEGSTRSGKSAMSSRAGKSCMLMSSGVSNGA